MDHREKIYKHQIVFFGNLNLEGISITTYKYVKKYGKLVKFGFLSRFVYKKLFC